MARFACFVALLVALTGCHTSEDWGAVLSPPAPSEIDFGLDDPSGTQAKPWAPVAEDCSNQQDDDLDQLVDCEDPSCDTDEVCADFGLRTVQTFHGVFWATWSVTEQTVYADSSGLDGTVSVTRQQWVDGQWETLCSSLTPVIGVRQEDAAYDLSFTVEPVPGDQADLCAFGAYLPSVPTVFGLQANAQEVWVERPDQGEAALWPIDEGGIDWSLFESSDNLHVSTLGGGLVLLLP